VADNHCVHALGDGDLPDIVLAHALAGTALAKSRRSRFSSRHVWNV
jgi:hypothetical protein